METEPETEEIVEESITLPEPTPIGYYTNDLLYAIRHDIRSMAEFVDTLKFVLELVLYALAGAMIGWCIGSLIL